MTVARPTRRLSGNQKLYICARAISQFGTELSVVSVAFAVLSFSSNALSLGLVLGARTFPALVFVLIGGALADRYPNKRMLVGSDTVALIAQAVLSMTLLVGVRYLPLVMILQTILGCATSLFWPSAASTVNRISCPEDRLALNAKVSVVENAGCLAGPIAAGLLVVVIGAAGTIAVDAVTYLVSALLLLRVEIPGRQDISEPRSPMSNLAEGLDYVRRQPWMIAGTGQFLVFQSAFAVFFTLGPVLSSTREYGTARWGFIVTAFGAGALLGSIAAARMPINRHLVAMEAALVTAIPSVIVLAYSTSLVATLITTAVAAAGFAVADVHWDTILQNRTPSENIGSVFAISMVGSATLRPFGYLMAGSIAVSLGTRNTLLATSMLLVVVTIVGASVIWMSEARNCSGEELCGCKRP
jgi:MFS family permease